jgi:hypothetical protein
MIVEEHRVAREGKKDKVWIVFGLLSYHYLGLHNRWISEGDSK